MPIVYLFFQSPPRREWLPQETETILSLNIDHFERDDLPKRWRKDQPDGWTKVWSGLIGGAARTPVMNLSRDAVRVTRSLATDNLGKAREFILIEGRTDVTPVIRAIGKDQSFERRTIGGLAVWERPDLAVARVGQTALAV